MLEPDKWGPPDKQKREPLNKQVLKTNRGSGGSCGSYSSFQENRKDRILGLYVKRPGLKNRLKAITI